ncbi:MAG: hypothetical protein OXU50_04855 [Gammaproteobacteria bacterium]|nr:hypothetical protein [Gammaproteobacteria bacterium]MDD9869202.1 hypothetical protein [Gammaproteobacteria bacterium]MDD9885863.1 hypothetical protein [Gammaproteobacteria bacterium]
MTAVREWRDNVHALVRRYHADAGFKAEMDGDPIGVLKREGFGDTLPDTALIPAGASVRLHIDDENTMHVVLPPVSCLQPADDEALAQISGGDYGGGYSGSSPNAGAWRVSTSYRLDWSWPSVKPRPRP